MNKKVTDWLMVFVVLAVFIVLSIYVFVNTESDTAEKIVQGFLMIATSVATYFFTKDRGDRDD